MAKVTSNLQVTVSKALAVRPGDDVDWTFSGNSLQETPSKEPRQVLDRETRLRLFDQATDRQRRRQRDARVTPADGNRGWSREDLYDRRPRSLARTSR